MVTNKTLHAALSALVLASSLVSGSLSAHCDTADGPVVADGKAALQGGDLSPVLKWIRPEAEAEIRAVFAKARAARPLGPEARELADQYFLETLVRVHRAGEGAPFTGIKPAGTPVDPAVALADQALQNGSADRLAKAMAHHVEEGIRERVAKALETKARAGQSVAQGRAFVAAYVELTHYAERLHHAATTNAAHAPASAASPAVAHEH